jgi:acetolactate synthase-1/2/3 large subunit
MANTKYSDALVDLLKIRGYTHVFMVAGGNIMHLIESFSKKMTIVPVVHEVAAVIGADYFNEVSSKHKALALVTVGPGLTNAVSGIAGANIDGRDVLIIGGQVKSSDLKNALQRQKGIQEVDGVALVKSITKASLRLDMVTKLETIDQFLDQSHAGRKGPIFLEICLDVQGGIYDLDDFQFKNGKLKEITKTIEAEDLQSQMDKLFELLKTSKRPMLLLGGGYPRNVKITEKLIELGIPIATTWNAADRLPHGKSVYAGRPNFFGQRFANIYIQQCDLLIVIGSSLGLQQTGFNVEEFIPNSRIVQVDIDSNVLLNSFRTIDLPINADAQIFLEKLLDLDSEIKKLNFTEWTDFLAHLKELCPLVEPITNYRIDYINPFELINWISKIDLGNINVIPCSSGGSYTATMQVFEQSSKHTIVSSKGLGSMGYGLPGAIGAALGNSRKTILIDGDGGFAQNLQELGTVRAQNLPLKIFLISNNGYSSIRSTQKKYFGGNYIGCDEVSKLGLPNWESVSEAYSVKYVKIDKFDTELILNNLRSEDPVIFEVLVHEDQPFLPKIDSKLSSDGKMESNPLHIMSPDIDPKLAAKVFKFL